MNIFKRYMGAAVLVLFLSQAVNVQAINTGEIDAEGLPEWPVKISSAKGKLLFSDSPEMVSEDGILYQDSIEGSARLFFYHVNAASTAKKLDVLLENKTNQPAHIVVSNSSLAGPGYSWVGVGKAANNTYLAGTRAYKITVPAKGTAKLSPAISDTAVLPNMLINGIYDFTTDRPVTVTIMMRPLFEDSAKFLKRAKVLSADQYHLRGTFNGANRELVPLKEYDPEKDGAVAVTLADNDVDPYVEGIDATDGSAVTNYGNYGVVYNVSLPSRKTGKMACFIVPLGGEYAGALGIKHPDVYWSPLATPRDRLSFGQKKEDSFAFLGTFEGGDPLSFIFSPPGASNLPVRIVVLPQ